MITIIDLIKRLQVWLLEEVSECDTENIVALICTGLIGLAFIVVIFVILSGCHILYIWMDSWI